MHNASKEVDFQFSKYEDLKINLALLDEREQFQEKNIRGLIKYAKKLTLELDQYR